LHGGTIQATSEVGAGTTMTVRIPRGNTHLPKEYVGTAGSRPELQSIAQPYLDEAHGWLMEDVPEAEAVDRLMDVPSEPEDPRRERILVVDDNADMRRFLLRLLEGRWHVETAADGITALEQIRRYPPDLVIADIMMPRMDGLELLQILRNEGPTAQLPVLLLSARAGEEASVGGLQAGADDYLVKPFSRRELQARVEARLAMAKQHAAERAARTQAEQTIRAREEFFAALAHELRSPAACLFTWIARLRDEDLHDSGALDVLEGAAHSVRRLAEDLLDVARTTSGQMRVERQPYASLSPLVAGVIEAYRPAADNRSLIIRTALEDVSGPVNIDADRVQQIVSNLLSNAIRFTPPGGRIEVRCRRRADTVELA